jgi:Reverse transcriptase (RNA-dependent DNA polymerase)
VCLLKKFLYGLKQSPRQWYKKFDSFIVSLNFSNFNYDSYFYLKKLNGGDYIYLLLYVYDILIAATNMGEIKKLKEQLGMTFEMKDSGTVKKILEIEITSDRSNRKLFFSQKEFVGKVIRRFGMEKANVVSTPLAMYFKLSAALSPTSDGERSYIEKISYSSVVGSLMYLMVCTQPDITQAVSVVSKHLSCAGKEHWEAVKWIFRYLKDIIDARLVFKNGDGALTGYVDSDFEGDIDKMRSLMGYIFILG